VLLRNAADTCYPDPEQVPDFVDRPQWRPYIFTGQDARGIRLLVCRYYAWLADDRVRWDMVEGANTVRLNRRDNPWYDYYKKQPIEDAEPIQRFWWSIPERNRVWFHVEVILPYESIVDIDEHGDQYFSHPHIYALFPASNHPFLAGEYHFLHPMTSFEQDIYMKEEDRTKFFPDEFPEADKGLAIPV
jgi:hypothetical protein